MDGDFAPTTWHDIGILEDIPVLGARTVTTSYGDIAIFRTSDNQVFALHDECPHKRGKLSQGIVHGHAVTCPLHNWVISLETGFAQEPDEGCTRRIPVRMQGEHILLGFT